MADYETGRESLTRLVEETSSHRENLNESDTRFHILDQLLNDVLGWPRSVIRTERHADGDYTDYELGTPPQLVVEAKRTGKAFVLPSGWDQHDLKLRTICEHSQEAKEAVEQVVRYAQQRGIPYAVASNGHQLFAFLGSRLDGVAPRDGKAVVFLSLEDMLDRFDELWDLLSPPAISAGQLRNRLARETLPAPPAKLSSGLLDYPGHKNRNPIAADLQILGGLFLEDLANDARLEDSFLRETYCKSGALSQFAVVSRSILEARYSAAFERDAEVSPKPVSTKEGLSKDLLSDALAASLSGRPILLVGDVGVGKSTFIRHLIKVDAKKELKRSLVFVINFGSQPVVAADLGKYVAREIARQARDKYKIDFGELNYVRSVYRTETKSFQKGIYAHLRDSNEPLYRQKEVEHLESLIADTDEHLKRCLEHAVINEKRQVVVFLDNIDQRPPGFQEQAFLIAQSLAASWPGTVFLSLRPETFVESRETGSLTAYQPRVFTIEPPRVDHVIQKRLLFAKKMLQETGRLPWMGEHVTLQSRKLESYIGVLIRAFGGNSDLNEFLDNMSAGNIRRALDFVTAFVGSAHVDSQKILDIEESAQYSLPMHEFVRAVMYQDCEHYSPAESPVPNIFDISARDGREHFLIALILLFVDRSGRTSGSDGYIERHRIYDFAQGLHYQTEQSRIALERCVDKNLLATPSGHRSDDHSRLRATTAGAFMAKRMLSLFSYVDPVIVDTPIVDPDFRSRISDARTIQERIERARHFVDYLDAQWQSVDPGAEEVLDWTAHSQHFARQLDEISRRAEEARRKRRR